MSQKKLGFGWIAFFILGGLVLFTAMVAFGQYLGGLQFARWQNIPDSYVTVHTLYDYWKSYGHIPAVKRYLLLSSLMAAAIPMVPVAFLIISLLPKQRELHGSARFANQRELLESGLLREDDASPSIIVGKYRGKYLTLKGQLFAFLAAPTRSGKGVGVVIPNLLHFRDSVVVNDTKLENWKKTAGFRKEHGQECYLFAPDSPEFRSHGWNPFTYIRRHPAFRVGDIMSIATMLYPSAGQDGNTAFFNENAQTLFLGLVLYMLDTPDEPCTMANLVRLTAPHGGVGLHQWIKASVAKRAEEGKPLSPECSNALYAFAGNSENTRAGILSSLQAPLNIFRDPVTAAATSRDDFDLRDVRKRRMSIYIGIQPNNLAKFSRLLNLFFSQLINENTRELPEDNPALRYQCLLLMDEFTSLGRINIFSDAIAYIAGYNLRPLLIFQNKSQVNEKYTRDGARTLLTNFALQIMFAPRDQEDAKEYSEMAGYLTVKSKSRSRSVGRAGGSDSESDQRRALLMPQEIKEIGQDKEIISMENIKPILAEKVRWYEDEVFKDRANRELPDVPVLDILPMLSQPIVETMRDATAEDMAKLAANDILNKDEILKAVGVAIGINLEELIDIQAAA